MSMDMYNESDDITLIIVRFPQLPETMKDENGDWKVGTVEKNEREEEAEKQAIKPTEQEDSIE